MIALEASGMPASALMKVQEQTVQVLSTVIGTYARDVAEDEVGPTGSGTSSKAKPKAGGCPTGLLYGRVQSGKTLAMILTTAMAMDNGFRVIVVLTSDNVSLVRQTAKRFAVLPGVNVRDSSQIGSWVEDEDHLRTAIAEGGLVLITAKNSSHLTTFIDFLRRVRATDYPALILDDEADQATLDTTTRARTGNPTKNAGKPSSAIHSKVVDNKLESGESIRAVLRHHVYLQVTATPYALLLQSTGNPLRPIFTELLEAGDGYTGSGFFFPKAIFDEGAAPLVFLSGQDAEPTSENPELSDGLRAALSYFLVASAAQGITSPDYRFRAQNFLCHTSVKKDDHRHAADLIKGYLKELYDCIKDPARVEKAKLALQSGVVELRRSCASVPPMDAIVEYVRKRLVDRELKIVNSEQDEADFGPKLNFIVGGNILGRGLTIENLLVTYYLRAAKIAQMDTMLQHARMFGYRAKAAPYLRVYIPELQALRFHRIHEAEATLREFISENKHHQLPVQVAKDLKATRTSVLDATHVVAYMPGEHLYPTAPLYRGKDAAARHEEALAWVGKLFPNKTFETIKLGALVPLSIDQIIEAVNRIPFEKFPGESWDPEAITAVLSSARKLYKDSGFLYARDARRGSLTQGMLSNEELKSLRMMGKPVLGIFRDQKKNLHTIGRTIEVKIDFTYIFPELIFPKADGLPAHVFNDAD